MAYIYRPKGKAGEYGELALNHYKGCGHGCRYCYVPPILYKSPDQFHGNPQARTLDHRILNKELEAIRGQTVFLCFTCDPYQPIDTEAKVTREIIQRLRLYDVSVNILTKGGLRSTRDFDLLAKDPQAKYGATLTFLNPEDSVKWEPHAALPQERIDALKKAHDLGIRTWASLEPVIDPDQSLKLIRQTKDFVDEYKIGRWNHDPRADRIDWKTFGEEAVELCREFTKKYYVKKDLAIFL
jgi:DNA repair photolyase